MKVWLIFHINEDNIIIKRKIKRNLIQWMVAMEAKIKIGMDAISHRLTERIKELTERYETPMPKLTNDVTDLTSKVEKHLKKMGYEL